MSSMHRNIEKMWWSQERPPRLLRLASTIYARINALNLKLRKCRAQSLPLPLISVGNITAGGSGKTPFVIWLAAELQQAGYRPVVICRGDGGSSREVQLLNDKTRPADAGDEAVLLYQRCNCPVIAGRDRVRAARMAAEYGDIVILDDGFQYRQLQRACDIVLIPAEGVGNGALIPAGPLREPLKALERADLIVRTGDMADIEPLSAGRQWRWNAVADRMAQATMESAKLPETVAVLTAIARPERLIRSLKQMRIGIAEVFIFPDHHPFSRDDIDRALETGMPVVATAKDAVKLTQLWPQGRELWILEQRIEAENGLFDAIVDTIVGKIGEGESREDA